MITSTVETDAATETSSVGLPSNDTSSFLGTTPPTSLFPIATTMAATTTTTTTTRESAEMECLDERAATPKSHRHSGSGSRGHWTQVWHKRPSMARNDSNPACLAT